MATTKAYVDSQIATVTALSALQGLSFQNEIINFPDLGSGDDVQPQWWEEADANATLTAVDIAGESITETYERGLKVVVATANSYAYQRYTYANEHRLKSGRTVSCAVAVWSVSSVSARVRLQSSVGSLGVSSTTTAAAWTILKVEGVVLDGTYVDLRMEVDVGTAYFVPLGFHIGSIALQLPPRGIRYRLNLNASTEIENLDGQTSKAVADLDLTSASSPIAVIGEFNISLVETGASTSNYRYYVRPNATPTDWAVNSNASPALRGHVVGDLTETNQTSFTCLFDDGQIVETCLEGVGTTTAINTCRLYLTGWWEWE